MKTVLTATLEIAYEEAGPAGGSPVILMHGFPDACMLMTAWHLRSPPPDHASSFRICGAMARRDSAIRRLHDPGNRQRLGTTS